MQPITETDLTAAVLQRLEQTPSPRLKEVMTSLVKHLHAFVQEVQLTEAEWLQGIQFLTETGHKCDDKRQEFILLSDALGVSIVVELINHHKLKSFGFAAHVVVVEIDPDTGALRFLRYAAVHDSGRIINPKVFEGKVYGAIAQGLGQALGEGMFYSAEGQPLTGSFLDYVMPRAKEMLPLHAKAMETPSPTNPLGLKGVGELPTVACPVAVVNAVLDALRDTPVRHLDAPVTQEKIWRAMQAKA